MIRSTLARVVLLNIVALVCVTQVNAWGFGGDSNAKDSRRARGRQDEQYDRVESRDEVDDYPRQKPDDRRRETKGQKLKRDRKKQMEEMERRRSRNKEEMVSQEYTKTIMKDEILDTDTPEDNDFLTDDEIHRLWAEHMHDFVPEDMLNLVIDKGQTFAVYQDMGHLTPQTVKGAYYVVGGNQDKTIGCVVYDANREIVYKRAVSPQGIIIFETTGPGEYTIVFMNQNYNGPLTVTLAFHTYEENKVVPVKYDIDAETGRRFEVKRDINKDDLLNDALGGEDNMAASDEQVQNVRRTLKEIQQAAKQIANEAKMSFLRQDGHNKDLMSNDKWNYYALIIEVIAFCIILGLQTHHLMKTMDNKLII